MRRWMIGTTAMMGAIVGTALLGAAPPAADDAGGGAKNDPAGRVTVDVKDAPAAAPAATPPPPAPGAAPVTPAPRTRRMVYEKAMTGAMPAAQRPPAKMEKVVYLGVNTSSANGALREQLKLKKNVGLVVDAVEGKGPADEAGIKQHDVLEKLNDQWLINPEQLGTLVRSMKSGDEVSIDLIRQGEHQTVKAKLAEREVAVGANADAALAMAPWMVDGVNLNADGKTVWLARPQPPGAIATLDPKGVAYVRRLDGRQKTEWSDDQVTIVLERDKGKTGNVTITDKATGKLLFTGTRPADDDPLFTARPDLKEKLKKAEEAGGPRMAAMQDGLILTPDQPGLIQNGLAPMRIAPPAVGGGGNFVGGGGGFGGGGNFGGGGVAMATGRGKVMKWQDDDHVLIMRMQGKQPTYLLALSSKNGSVLYDGPVMTDEQRKSVPAEVGEKFEMVVANPDQAKEFGAQEKVPKDEKIKEAKPR